MNVYLLTEEVTINGITTFCAKVFSDLNDAQNAMNYDYNVRLNEAGLTISSNYNPYEFPAVLRRNGIVLNNQLVNENCSSQHSFLDFDLTNTHISLQITSEEL